MKWVATGPTPACPVWEIGEWGPPLGFLNQVKMNVVIVGHTFKFYFNRDRLHREIAYINIKKKLLLYYINCDRANHIKKHVFNLKVGLTLLK